MAEPEPESEEEEHSNNGDAMEEDEEEGEEEEVEEEVARGIEFEGSMAAEIFSVLEPAHIRGDTDYTAGQRQQPASIVFSDISGHALLHRHDRLRVARAAGDRRRPPPPGHELVLDGRGTPVLMGSVSKLAMSMNPIHPKQRAMRADEPSIPLNPIVHAAKVAGHSDVVAGVLVDLPAQAMRIVKNHKGSLRKRYLQNAMMRNAEISARNIFLCFSLSKSTRWRAAIKVLRPLGGKDVE
ncbi:hypothetical protein C8R46DRAFT_1047824 [Mycena filopes]|nr:hypothetical protein C8R46DRAFT_1047824 [Mycena filopes]